MRPWISLLPALAVLLGCSHGDSFGVSSDAGSDVSATASNGTYRCDGVHAQQLDVASGQWSDAGGCGLQDGTGSVLRWAGGPWNDETWSAGSATLPTESRMTEQHRLVAGVGDDVWWIASRHVLWSEHAMLFHSRAVYS